MDRVSINTNTPVISITKFNVEYMEERDGELVIKLNGNECYDIDDGEILMLRRTVIDEINGIHDISEEILVKHEDSDHVIHATLPKKEKIYISRDSRAIRRINGYNNGQPFTYHIIQCEEEHHMYAQDIDAVGQEIYLKKYNGDDIINGTYDDIYIPLRYSNNIATSADCISDFSVDETCGRDYDMFYTKMYKFLPVTFFTNSFIISGFNETHSEEIYYFEKKFNPYYYYTIETDENDEPIEFDLHGEPVKHCHFYEDYWWSLIESNVNERYIYCGSTNSMLCKDSSFYNVGIGVSSDSNETDLGVEDYFSEEYAKMIEESLVPPFIDMERVKYVPMYNVGDGEYDIINCIKIYPHFRQRRTIETEEDILENSVATSGNVYFDSWDIDSDSGNTKWWNCFIYNGDTFSNASFSTYFYGVEENWKKADLLGYLNFTDKDVRYRKNKVSKSFFRFSFYNSNDPIEQKLLFYSTVFFDGTTMYGKYSKQDESDYASYTGYSGNQNTVGVFYDGDESKRIDTEIVLTNEYDTTKSAEGFNIYLFADDVPSGNTSKTIYMKIEFNHAGNGKTIPLIIWPKVGTTYRSLTIDNFLENLYIPIEIKNYNGKYIYSISGGTFNDGTFEFAVFEPKLDVT